MPDFWIDAKRAGWKDKTVISWVRQSVGEVETPEDTELIVQELENMMQSFGPKPDQDIKEWHKKMKSILDKYWAMHK